LSAALANQELFVPVSLGLETGATADLGIDTIGFMPIKSVDRPFSWVCQQRLGWVEMELADGQARLR
jgi:hypothetical protein